jgi:DNA-binding cell septation regulator SpoVG
VTAIQVQDVRMVAANASDRATGVLAFVNATINGLVVDGLTVRRGLNGGLRLGFPKHRDRYDRMHAVVRPADDAVRQALTREILGALALDAAATARPDAQEESGP